MTLVGGMESVAGFAQVMSKMGIPAHEVVVWIVLCIKVVGGAMLILGWHSRVAAAAIALFTFGTIVVVHNNLDEMISALKNLAIIGGLLYVIASGPGPYTIVSLLKGNASGEAQKQNNAAKASL
jgi:putative oxidoreductase